MTFSPFFLFDSNWPHPAHRLTCLFLPYVSSPFIIEPSGQEGSDQHQNTLGTKPQTCWPLEWSPVLIKLEITSRPQLWFSSRPRKVKHPINHNHRLAKPDRTMPWLTSETDALINYSYPSINPINRDHDPDHDPNSLSSRTQIFPLYSPSPRGHWAARV